MSNTNVAEGKKRRGAGFLRWLGRVVLGLLILLLGLAAVGAIYQAIATARDAQTYKPLDQMVDVNGIQMRLDCSGTGSPTVVLEAGGESSAIVWARVQGDVAQFTRVCSYDRAGYGWSDPVREELVPQRVAEMLHDLLAQAGEKPPYLMVAHSMGGVYVRTFTAVYPADVVGMVLVDTSHENQTQLAKQLTPAEIRESPESIEAAKAQRTILKLLPIAEPLGLLRAFKIMDAGAASLQLPEEKKAAFLAESYRTGYMAAYLREVNMMEAYFEQGGKPNSLGDIPLIVLSAELNTQKMSEQYAPSVRSKLTTDILQQQVDALNGLHAELAGLSTRGKWIIVPGTGHFIQLDAPQVVTDAIREVFGQVRQ